jgi:hypothetical protein
MAEVSRADAARALGNVDERRRQIVAEIGVPSWYWWFLAAGWIGLGLITVVGTAWLTTAATLAFGAFHSSVATRAIDGRHGSRQLTVRSEVVGRHTSALVIGFLLVLVAATVGVALVINALGTPQPALIASIVVAIAVLVGGPQLMRFVRRRAEETEPR